MEKNLNFLYICIITVLVTIMFSQEAFADYCGSQGNNVNYEWIASVTVNEITKISGNENGGYSDFTAEPTINLNTGSTQNTVSLTPGFQNSAYAESWKIWIDLNHDDDFDDSGENVYSGNTSAAETLNGNFLISNADEGNTRMRVSMKYNGMPSPCEQFTYGEVEDYTVNIGSVITENIFPTIGNVGIGTKAPTELLHVEGEGYPSIVVKTTSTTGNTAAQYAFGSDRGNEAAVIQYSSSSDVNPDTLFVINKHGDIRLYTGTEGISSEKVRIDSDGNVGIGTTSPDYKLHVYGDAAGTSWTNLSSFGYKDDIKKVDEPIHDEMLTQIMKLDLTTYKYKKEYGGDGSIKLGFIAEEMPKEVLSKDGKGVDVYELQAFTIGAMKAQQKMIEEQRKRIEKLEAKLLSFVPLELGD